MKMKYKRYLKRVVALVMALFFLYATSLGNFFIFFAGACIIGIALYYAISTTKIDSRKKKKDRNRNCYDPLCRW